MQRALQLGQHLDEDRLTSDDAMTAKSYISFDCITVLSEVEWNTNGDELMNILRSEQTPTIDSTYINTIFGDGKNGI